MEFAGDSLEILVLSPSEDIVRVCVDVTPASSGVLPFA